MPTTEIQPLLELDVANIIIAPLIPFNSLEKGVQIAECNAVALRALLADFGYKSSIAGHRKIATKYMGYLSHSFPYFQDGCMAGKRGHRQVSLISADSQLLYWPLEATGK